MAPKAPEENLKYIIQALSTAAEVNANYHELASMNGIRSANNAQKKFKVIIEASGEFKLINDRVVSVANGTAIPPTPPPASTTTRKKRSAPPPTPTITSNAGQATMPIRKKIKKNASMSGAAIATADPSKNKSKETITRSVSKSAATKTKDKNKAVTKKKGGTVKREASPSPTPIKFANVNDERYPNSDTEDDDDLRDIGLDFPDALSGYRGFGDSDEDDDDDNNRFDGSRATRGRRSVTVMAR